MKNYYYLYDNCSIHIPSQQWNFPKIVELIYSVGPIELEGPALNIMENGWSMLSKLVCDATPKSETNSKLSRKSGSG